MHLVRNILAPHAADLSADSPALTAAKAQAAIETAKLKKQTGKTPTLLQVIDAGQADGTITAAQASLLANAHNAQVAAGNTLFQQAASAVGQTIGTAVTDVGKVADQDLSTVGKAVGGSVGKDLSSLGSAVASTAAKVGGGIDAGFVGAASDVQHLGNSIASGLGDVLKGVAGAVNTLITLAKGMNPADLVKLVDGELAQIQADGDKLFGAPVAAAPAPAAPPPPPPPPAPISAGVVDSSGRQEDHDPRDASADSPALTAAKAQAAIETAKLKASTGKTPTLLQVINAGQADGTITAAQASLLTNAHAAQVSAPTVGGILDLSTISIPKTGTVASLFPANLRGQVVHWVDARKNAGDIVWYLAAAALVDATALKNLALRQLGTDLSKIFGADTRPDRDYGIEPVTATLAGNAPLIVAVVVVVLVIAAAIVKAVVPSNTILAKIVGAIGGVADSVAEKMGILPTPQPPTPQPPTPSVVLPRPGVTLQQRGSGVAGHSNPLITYLVIGLFVATAVALLFWDDIEDAL